jgi:hypothetical protein
MKINISTILAAALTGLIVQAANPAMARIVKMKYVSAASLEKSCKKSGGDFIGTPSEGKHSCWGKNGSSVDCDSNKKTCKGFVANAPASNPKKRPKVLQEGGGGGNSNPVNPTVLGSDNPRATPRGDLQDITGDGTLQ